MSQQPIGRSDLRLRRTRPPIHRGVAAIACALGLAAAPRPIRPSSARLGAAGLGALAISPSRAAAAPGAPGGGSPRA